MLPAALRLRHQVAAPIHGAGTHPIMHTINAGLVKPMLCNGGIIAMTTALFGQAK